MCSPFACHTDSFNTLYVPVFAFADAMKFKEHRNFSIEHFTWLLSLFATAFVVDVVNAQSSQYIIA